MISEALLADLAAKLVDLKGVVTNFLESIGPLLPVGQMELTEMAEIYSNAMDKMIDEEQLKGNRFAGGKFIITYIDDTGFQLSYDLYFKNREGKWLRKSSASGKQDMKYFSPEAVDRLRAEKKVEFPVYAPGRGE